MLTWSILHASIGARFKKYFYWGEVNVQQCLEESCKTRVKEGVNIL